MLRSLLKKILLVEVRSGKSATEGRLNCGDTIRLKLLPSAEATVSANLFDITAYEEYMK